MPRTSTISDLRLRRRVSLQSSYIFVRTKTPTISSPTSAGTRSRKCKSQGVSFQKPYSKHIFVAPRAKNLASGVRKPGPSFEDPSGELVNASNTVSANSNPFSVPPSFEYNIDNTSADLDPSFATANQGSFSELEYPLLSRPITRDDWSHQSSSPLNQSDCGSDISYDSATSVGEDMVAEQRLENAVTNARVCQAPQQIPPGAPSERAATMSYATPEQSSSNSSKEQGRKRHQVQTVPEDRITPRVGKGKFPAYRVIRSSGELPLISPEELPSQIGDVRVHLSAPRAQIWSAHRDPEVPNRLLWFIAADGDTHPLDRDYLLNLASISQPQWVKKHSFDRRKPTV